MPSMNCFNSFEIKLSMVFHLNAKVASEIKNCFIQMTKSKRDYINFISLSALLLLRQFIFTCRLFPDRKAINLAYFHFWNEIYWLRRVARCSATEESEIWLGGLNFKFAGIEPRQQYQKRRIIIKFLVLIISRFVLVENWWKIVFPWLRGVYVCEAENDFVRQPSRAIHVGLSSKSEPSEATNTDKP